MPAAGARIVLWPDDEGDPRGGSMWTVKEPYMAADGSWHVDLTAIVVDPCEADRQEMQRAAATGHWSANRYSSWWTDSEGGPPEPMLTAGGWATDG